MSVVAHFPSNENCSFGWVENNSRTTFFRENAKDISVVQRVFGMQRLIQGVHPGKPPRQLGCHRYGIGFETRSGLDVLGPLEDLGGLNNVLFPSVFVPFTTTVVCSTTPNTQHSPLEVAGSPESAEAWHILPPRFQHRTHSSTHILDPGWCELTLRDKPSSWVHGSFFETTMWVRAQAHRPPRMRIDDQTWSTDQDLALPVPCPTAMS